MQRRGESGKLRSNPFHSIPSHSMNYLILKGTPQEMRQFGLYMYKLGLHVECNDASGVKTWCKAT